MGTKPTGITLRQFYAAMAMQAMWRIESQFTDRQRPLHEVAEMCFRMADAMSRAEQEESK